MTREAGMRRSLLLVRHAKSAWDDASLADHDRPLAPRGRRALPQLHDHLMYAQHRPELVMCSSACRTMETLDGIRAAIPQQARVELDTEFYVADADALSARIREVDNSIACTMVIGHNPTIQDVALRLTGSGDPDLRAQIALKVPTGAVVTLSFDGAWADLSAESARIDDFFVPRRPRV
jgi:phosphohistidine phosphatase